MAYLVAVYSDAGLEKKINQDSVCVMEARSEAGDILMAAVCDGMGGLQRGELASAEVVLALQQWFREELPSQIRSDYYEKDILCRWSEIFQQESDRISAYGREHKIELGTTATVILLVNGRKCLLAHIGDTRMYRYGREDENRQAGYEQLTEDHTIVASEVRAGKLTAQEAEEDPRQHVLYQCIGASGVLTPQLEGFEISGNEETGSETFLLCTDGFRHRIGADEMADLLHPDTLADETDMEEKLRILAERAKERQEQDNISSVLVRIAG